MNLTENEKIEKKILTGGLLSCVLTVIALAIRQLLPSLLDSYCSRYWTKKNTFFDVHFNLSEHKKYRFFILD